MGERVRVVRHEGGLLAAKDTGERGLEALRAEARVLLAVQGPGVVELVGITDGAAPALLTRWVGSRSLADVPVPMGPDRAAAVCLAVAATVARLHRGGVVHGGIDPTHVLLDSHGRPVLCGFGGAGPIGAPVRRPVTDPGRAHGVDHDGDAPRGEAGDLRPAFDVAGLGLVLDHLLGARSPTGPRAPWRPPARRTAARHRALRAVADHAMAPDPSDRPSVAGFAHAVRRAAPGAHLEDDRGDGNPPVLPSSSAARPHPRRPTTRRRATRGRHARPDRRPSGILRPGRPSAALGVAAVAAVAAATCFGLLARWAPSAERRADAAPAARPAPTPTAGSSITPLDDAPPVVEHGGRRFEIGSAGDVVLVGPWRCDGRDLPVVLHPADGTVHLFESWAAEGASLDARAVATVVGATGLERSDAGAGCADLVITVVDGSRTTLTTEDLR